ncbi:hypothetical protein [Arthrobacter globiformis]|uniref:hypothetical protein n=1 Tax=Arthrobacter globiformis TaxID=1665 RepID=UPI00278EEA9C|nr:hypothetical protein [Arthrobacter globiformis]MDQ0618052.1 hypothetical protein [Arthrobacter globiformis]
MWFSRSNSLPVSRSTRRWWFIVIVLMAVATVVFILTRPVQVPVAEPVPPLPMEPTPEASTKPAGRSTAAAPTSAPTLGGSDVPASPRTTDYRKLASAAAKTIYTWDTRTSSYSEVYSRVRGWWNVLPDGSNPLTVLVHEFEATGINAGTYASLAGQRARRTAAVQFLRCDFELAKVRERPAPWAGLHVCTVSLRVMDQTGSSRNIYTAPVSVMMNCPPADTAPRDHCVVVGFYAAANRIVY